MVYTLLQREIKATSPHKRTACAPVMRKSCIKYECRMMDECEIAALSIILLIYLFLLSIKVSFVGKVTHMVR